MKIETARLIIRDFEKEDWSSVHEYASQAKILIYEPWGPNSIEETKTFVNHSVQEAQKETRRIFEFAITLKTSGALIGGCGLRYLALNPEKMNLGYIINPKYWNQGYATEACNSLIGFAQNHLISSGVVATCDEFNLASQRVLEKCGMMKVKTSPKLLKSKQRRSKTFHYEFQLQ